MFRTTDKFTLTLINARDINGYILPFSLKLPLNNEEIKLPKELASIEIHEYCEGPTIWGTISYKLYIGNTTTLINLIPNFNTNGKRTFKINDYLKIKSIEDTLLCYQEIDGIKRIYAIIDNQDIVVKDQNELLKTIQIISNEFSTIKNSINKIKTLSKNK